MCVCCCQPIKLGFPENSWQHLVQIFKSNSSSKKSQTNHILINFFNKTQIFDYSQENMIISILCGTCSGSVVGCRVWQKDENMIILKCRCCTTWWMWIFLRRVTKIAWTIWEWTKSRRGRRNKTRLIIKMFSISAEEVSGPVLKLWKVSRMDMGAYMCIARNGVPPAVSKRIELGIDCESFDL